MYSHILFLLLVVSAIIMTSVVHAQKTPDKILAKLESMPRTKAIIEINKWLDATAKAGNKE